MKAAVPGLGDAPVETWDPPFQGPIDGMILVGSENDTALRLKRDAIANLLLEGGGRISLVLTIIGQALLWFFYRTR
jgi:hypothetical protein